MKRSLTIAGDSASHSLWEVLPARGRQDKNTVKIWLLQENYVHLQLKVYTRGDKAKKFTDGE